MSVFQFAKFQRVTIPSAMAGGDNVQGLVAEGHAELGAEPRYILQWPNAAKLGDGGLFTMIVGEVGQGELIKAQPPKMLTVLEADQQANKFARDECDRVRAEMERDFASRLRAARNASRKRTRK